MTYASTDLITVESHFLVIRKTFTVEPMSTAERKRREEHQQRAVSYLDKELSSCQYELQLIGGLQVSLVDA